jgi:hypothetical protein
VAKVTRTAALVRASDAGIERSTYPEQPIVNVFHMSEFELLL